VLFADHFCNGAAKVGEMDEKTRKWRFL